MRNYEFREEYRIEEPRNGKCPEGYDYVKGYHTKEGTFVRAYCRESQRIYDERKRSFDDFVERKRRADELTARLDEELNELGKDWGVDFESEAFPERRKDGKDAYTLNSIGMSNQPIAGMLNVNTGKVITKDSMRQQREDVDVEFYYDNDKKEMVLNWSSIGSRSPEITKNMAKNLMIASERAEKINEVLARHKEFDTFNSILQNYHKS